MKQTQQERGLLCCSYEEMRQELFLLQEQYGQKALRIRRLGLSEDGREILLASAGPENADCSVLVQASIHGREYLNTALALGQLREYLAWMPDKKEQPNSESPYNKEGTEKASPFHSLCIHVIPMANPDGVTISQAGPEGIRSRRLRTFLWDCYRRDWEEGLTCEEPRAYFSRWKANARGVDLNRNFSAGWRNCQGSAYPSPERYKGEHPYSEAETRAIGRALLGCRPDCCISYHSSGNLVYWGFESAGRLKERCRQLAFAASAATGYPLWAARESAIDQAGCSDECVSTYGIPALTIENGKGDCPLPAEEFPGISLANRDLWAALAQWYRKGKENTLSPQWDFPHKKSPQRSMRGKNNAR